MKKPAVRIIRYFINIQCLLMLVITGQSATPVALAKLSLDTGTTGDFQEAQCVVDLPANVREGKDVICGYLSVPEQHQNPDSPRIKLAVMIIKSSLTTIFPDPLYIAQGGPGGSTIDTYASLFLSTTYLSYNRDVVLFDQRGTLYSQPSLMCSEIDELVEGTIELDLSKEKSQELEYDATSDCHSRLVEDGIDLSAYNSFENAADIDALRKALGHTTINLYGVSYGTLLALHTMQLFPQGLRSVILDGVVPPQINYLLETAQTENRVLNKLFTACAADDDCNHNYPELEKTFFKLIDDLEKNPARAPMVDPETGKVYNALIDGESFRWGIFQLFYIADIIPALPRMIYDAKRGDFEVFAKILPLFLFDRTFSYGMYYSVLCSEDSDFKPEDQNLTGVNPQIIEYEKDNPKFFLDICALWDVKSLGAEADNPVTSEIPTLILSGDFDPVTPPAYGQAAAQTLKNSFTVEFPIGSHGSMFEGDCQNQIIQSFLDNPESPPDTSCINDINKMVFFTPRSVVELPIIISILNLEAAIQIDILLLLLCLVIFSTAIIIFPLGWLMRRRKKPIVDNELMPEREPILVRSAAWISVGYAILLWVVIIFIAVTGLIMAFDNDMRVYYGLPGNFRALFGLFLIMPILGIAMLAGSLQAWIKHNWSLIKRMYYTMLAITALISLFILAKWGVFTALLK